MQISKNLFQLCGQAYGVHPNVYAIRHNEQLILIDSGTGQQELTLIRENLEEWGLSSLNITHLLLTHSHFDHSGNAHVFAEEGAKIAAGALDAAGVEAGDERTLSYSYEQSFVPCKVEEKLADGQVLNAAGLAFQCFHVPGHSAGSMAYMTELDGKIILFTGDAVMAGPNGQPKLGVSVDESYDPDTYLASLKKLSKLKPDYVLGGHFQPCLRKADFLLKRGYRTGLIQLRTPSIPTLH